MSFDTQSYIELFYQDAEEHLQLMTDALLDLEKNPADKEALAAVFRSAHTMKSSSAMVGFMHISEFTHKMEDLIGYLRDQDVAINTATVDILFQAFDTLKDMLAQLQDGASEAQRNDTNHKAKKLIVSFDTLSGSAPEEVEPAKPVKKSRIHLDAELRTRVEEMRLAGERIMEIGIDFCADVQMASTRAFLIVNNLRQVGTILKTDPDIDNDEEEVVSDFAILFATTTAVEKLEPLTQVSSVKSVSIREVTDIEQFEWPDEKSESTGQDESQAKKAPIQEGTEKKVDDGSDSKQSLTSFERREDRSKVQTVRVDIEKLDRLLNLAAEMVIQRGRAAELGRQLVAESGKGGLEEELFDAIIQQGMYLNQLQETIMNARMVPIGIVFTRFRRVVRDLANTRKKKVNLVIEGEETELDKKIIDQLGDPLMHMVRNSVDHGLETPEERIAAGKTPDGLLHLNAIHQGNNIVVTIKDDGHGIDVEVIRKKAIEKGMLSPEEAQLLSRKETLNLIFRSGFSTAKEVTDISGRGVGMDVVRRSIETLGGSVEIETEVGVGTTFYIKVPLTLAIIQALLVESGDEMYALPIVNISETIRITKSDVFSVKGKGEVIRLRDEVVPILNLQEVVSGNGPVEKADKFYVAILRHGNDFAGLIVDRMVNEQEIVIKSLSGDVSTAPYIAGASILGNGRVILILDTVSLVEQMLGSSHY